MPYVERRDGKICGIYANLQPGYAEEELAHDHADVVAFLAATAPPTSKQFQARDFIDQLTPDDLRKIQTAVAADADLDLLWLRLRAREGKPVIAEGEAFAQGWAGLAAALGKERSAAIADALGIPTK